ncbi:MAG: response regulator [Bacteroidota bacterium]
MSKIKVFVVEDDTLFANQLEMYLDELGYWLVGTADNAKDAVEMIAAVRPDLILMDIHLKERKDGVDIARRIKHFNQAPIIFISSLDDAATYERVKSVLPIAFLNKPVSKQKLKRTIELIVNQIRQLTIAPVNRSPDTPLHISIKNQQQIERLELKDLISVEVLDKRCQLNLVNRTIELRTPLKDLQKKLPPVLFLQTHRSFVVNLQHIKQVNLADHIIFLSNGSHVPLSRSYREAVIAQLNVV